MGLTGTDNGVAHGFKRAVVRAGILTGDVTLHTLRHTAIDDYTIMELVGHITKKMLERYTHPTNARKVDALETFSENLDG